LSEKKNKKGDGLSETAEDYELKIKRCIEQVESFLKQNIVGDWIYYNHDDFLNSKDINLSDFEWNGPNLQLNFLSDSQRMYSIIKKAAENINPKYAVIIEGLDLEEYTIKSEQLNHKKYPISLTECAKKYPALKKDLQNVDPSEKKIWVTESEYLVLKYKNKMYELMFLNYLKVTISNTDGSGFDKDLINSRKETLVFRFNKIEHIRDIYLNRDYFSIKNIITIKNNNIKSESLKIENIADILNYVSTDATKNFIKPELENMDRIMELVKNACGREKKKSCVFTIVENEDGSLELPEVEHNPIMHPYSSIPGPDELFEKLEKVSIDDGKKKELLRRLTTLNRDHNIATMAYFLGTLLVNVVKYETTPYLILYQGSNCGKTKTAELFDFFKVNSDGLNPYRYKNACNGWGCGFTLIDEPSKMNKQLIDHLKDMATSEKYNRVEQNTRKAYIYKVGGLIASNNIYEINTANPEDLKAFFRRNVVLKLGETDKLSGIGNTMRYLDKHKTELKKIFIDFVLGQNSKELLKMYDAIEEEDAQYKFMIFSLKLLKRLFTHHGIDFISESDIVRIIERMKETEKEFESDVLNDINIVEMIEQIIYNDIVRRATGEDKDPLKFAKIETLNKYTETVFKEQGYTIRYLKDGKIRIGISKTGLPKLLSKLNKDYATNYPENVGLEYFVEKLRNRGVSAKIGRARMGGNDFRVRGIIIDYDRQNKDISKYMDILNIIIPLAKISGGKVEASEIINYCESRGIKQERYKEGFRVMLENEYLKETDEKGIYIVDFSKMKLVEDSNIPEEEFEEIENEHYKVRDAIFEIIDRDRGGAIYEEVIRECTLNGHSLDLVKKVIDDLIIYGEITKDGGGFIRR